MEEVARINYLEYENLDKEIKRSMKRSAAEVVRLGFFLRKMADEQKYLVAYPDFDSYLQGELHIEYSRANRFMNINKRFSFNGNSITIDEKYEEYSQSLLEEMLSMPEGLEEKITPDMTVGQVREIKRQARQQEQENTFDVDYKEIEERQERMIATSQEQVDTGSEAALQEEIITEIDEDVEADPKQEDLSVDFNTDELLEELDTVIDAEYRKVEDPEEKSIVEGLSAYGLPKTEYPPDSLLTEKGCGHRYVCFDCAQECGIRQEERYCREAPLGNPYSCMTMDALDILKSDTGVSGCQFINQELADKTARGMPVPCCKKCPAKNVCGYCCENARQESYGPDGQQSVATSQQFTKEKEVSAAEMQQELPELNNNDQRKQWLREYKNWGLWYRDENIDINYYKFDFSDGSRLVVAEYPQRLCCWRDEPEDEHYFHLLEKNKMGYQTRYDEKYRQQTDSETYLVEFLKNIQKKGDTE